MRSQLQKTLRGPVRAWLIMAGFSLVSVPGAAYAGFEWTPPAPASASPAMPPVMAAPVDQVESHPIDPDLAPVSSQMPAPAAATVWPEQNAPVISAPKQAAVSAEPEHYEEAVGFGRDIPLALTLQQVVPAGYAYSFDPGIDPGMAVSWDGGKGWNVVLEHALKPHGLGVVIVDKTVWIRSAEESEEQEPVREVAEVPEPALVVEQFSPPAEMTPEPAMKTLSYDDSRPQTAPEPVFIPGPENTLVQDLQSMTEAEKEAYYREIGSSDLGYNPSYPRRNPVSPVAEPSYHGNKPEEAPVMASKDIPEDKTVYEPITTPEAGNNPFSDAPSGSSQPTSIVPQAAMKPSARPVPVNNIQGALDPYEIRFWQAGGGESLKETLAAWSEASNVTLYWNAPYDYRLPDGVEMHGTYPDAVAELLTSYGDMASRPLGRLHPNLPSGPSVLVIESETVTN